MGKRILVFFVFPLLVVAFTPPFLWVLILALVGQPIVVFKYVFPIGDQVVLTRVQIGILIGEFAGKLGAIVGRLANLLLGLFGRFVFARLRHLGLKKGRRALHVFQHGPALLLAIYLINRIHSVTFFEK